MAGAGTLHTEAASLVDSEEALNSRGTRRHRGQGREIHGLFLMSGTSGGRGNGHLEGFMNRAGDAGK